LHLLTHPPACIHALLAGPLQTYLEQNEGAGLQHLALKTNDIFHTLREMSARSRCGGFDFMPRPSDKYYKELPAKIVSVGVCDGAWEWAGLLRGLWDAGRR
jgi:hypothetical protein